MNLYFVFSNEPTQAVYGDPANAQPGETWLPFEPVDGDMVAQHYVLQNGAVVYSPPVAPLNTSPQPDTFRLTIVDGVNSGTLPVQIIQHLATLHALAFDTARLQSVYAKFKSSAPAWMAPANFTFMEAAAAAANMPLVAT